MITIKLEREEWRFDETARLGSPGGFGEVFKGSGAGGEVAVKRLKIDADAAAHRELKIGAVLRDRSLKHIVPVLDCGQDALSDRYFLVMPICEKSLQDELRIKGAFDIAEARTIMLHIMYGLKEASDLIHRDLKPGNVLYTSGVWQVADFGIAKFVEDSTSLNTLRGSLTPGFGAPEQWKGQAPSPATDIYALGCIMYALLTGAPPFTGDVDKVREAHLHQTPQSLDAAGLRLSALTSQMLRKSPSARPTLARCIDAFEKETSAAAGAGPARHTGLLEAAQSVATQQAAADAKAQAEAARKAERDQLLKEATAEHSALRKRLFDVIKDQADPAHFEGPTLTLGRATLSVSDAMPMAPGRDGANLSASTWDVVAFSLMSVKKPHDSGGQLMSYDNSYTWSATLAFASTPNDPSYRWRELAFWSFGRSADNNEPRAVAPIDRDFDIALSNIAGVMNLAYGPFPVDGEDEERFQHRWMTLLSRAANGKLTRPNQMPISNTYFD